MLRIGHHHGLWFFRIKQSKQQGLTSSLWPWAHPKGMYLSSIGNNGENLCQKHSGALFGFPGNTITHGAITHADALMRYGSLTTKTSVLALQRRRIWPQSIGLLCGWCFLAQTCLQWAFLFSCFTITNTLGIRWAILATIVTEHSKCSLDMKPLKNTQLQSFIHHFVALCNCEVTRWLWYQNLAQSLSDF